MSQLSTADVAEAEKIVLQWLQVVHMPVDPAGGELLVKMIAHKLSVVRRAAGGEDEA